ncbi:MAG: hypothetical protein HQL06_12985 [Nitrospirae bacterium]|nr:hypothetical protein [Nitrospirota bacterium]
MLLDKPLSIEYLLDDEVERRQLTSILSLVDSIELSDRGSIRLLLKGGWGSGKTTYLRMLESFFKDYCAYPVVFINKWQRENPLIEILLKIGELQGLNPLTKSKLKTVLKPMMTSNVLLSGTFLSTLTAHVTETFEEGVKLVEELVERFTTDSRKTEVQLKAILSEIRDDYEAGKTLNVYKKWLQYLLELPVPEKQKKLFVLIFDNLDRKGYLKVVEAISTYFDVNGVLIIAALNDTDSGADVRYIESVFPISVELPHSAVNDLHIASIRHHVTNKQLTYIKETLSSLDPLPHRKWIKLIDRLENELTILKDKKTIALEKMLFTTALKELFPKVEVFSRQFPYLPDRLFVAKPETNDLDTSLLVMALEIINTDDTNFRFPSRNFEMLKEKTKVT